MTLPEISIKRRVFAWMLNAMLVLFGLVAFDRIGIDRYPYIDFPMISVTTILPGANPEIIDASITNLIETAVNAIPGIEHVQSDSASGASVVRITFQLTKDIDVAFNEVQAKVNQVLRDLPNDADPPIVAQGGVRGHSHHVDRVAGGPHLAAAQPVRAHGDQKTLGNHRWCR